MKNTTNIKSMLAALLLLVGPYLYGQSYNGLKIGDRLPDVSVKMLYGSGKTVSTAEFNDKLLIIDFWATTCSGCVAALPHMQRLQEQFGGKLKVLPVTYEPARSVDAFWKTNVHTRGLNLATVVEDTLFKSYFPHVAIPHEVWVYKGKVIGITDPEYVDSANINLVLSGKVPLWPFKNDFYAFDGRSERLFGADKRQIDMTNTWLYYSAVGNYREKDGASAAGVFGSEGTVRDTPDRTIKTWLVNKPLFLAYLVNWMQAVPAQALNKPSLGIDPNQIVWEVKDPLRYMHRSPITPGLDSGYQGDWMRSNAICFESVKADTGQGRAEIARGVIADLNRLFALDVRWEKRREKVLVLVGAKGVPPAKAKENKTVHGSYTVKSVADLLYQINQQPSNPYVFQGKGVALERLLGISISSWTDIAAIRLALQDQGLQLREEERIVDKFVFTELPQIR